MDVKEKNPHRVACRGGRVKLDSAWDQLASSTTVAMTFGPEMEDLQEEVTGSKKAGSELNVSVSTILRCSASEAQWLASTAHFSLNAAKERERTRLVLPRKDV